MKIILLFLVLLNVLFYGWSNWVAIKPLELAVVTPEPEAQPLVLFEEKYPQRARAEREAKEKIERDARLARQEAARAEQEALAARSEALAEDIADAVPDAEPGPGAEAAGAQDDVTDGNPGEAAGSATPGDSDGDAPPAEEIVEAPASLVVGQVTDAPDEAIETAPETAAPAPGPPLAPTPEQAADMAPGQLAGQAVAQAPGQAPRQEETEVPEEALAALDELEKAVAEATPVPTVAMMRDGSQVARCVSLGPFINLRDTAQASAQLGASGLETSRREEQARIWVGHWVYLPPAESRAAAIAVVERLRADGVSDLYIETSGERRNAISLGLFSDAAGAETRAGKIRRLDVRPEIRDRYRNGTLYWIDFDLAEGEDVDPAQFEGGSVRRAIRLEERDCAEAAATG